jgi:hypothetical protein
MRTSITARRSLLVPVLGLALAATMTACSSSSSSSSSTVAPSASATTSSPTAAATTSAPASPTASASPSSTFTGTAATIAKNWVTFMTGTTPTATKVSLLQDGSKFSAVIAGEGTSAEAEAAGATVQSVTLTSSTEATVEYTITVSGTAMLANQKGTAVLEDGVWKVGDASFCSLAALQSGGKAVPGCSAS